MPRTLVVIPTYNEKENLANMVAALFALEIDDLSVLVVDDNSPDGTGQIADDLVQQHPGRMHVLHREGKGGLGRAYIAGWRYAIENLDVDYLIQMDADFSHQPKYVPQLIHKMSEGYDVVMASRYVTGGSVEEEWGVYRKLLSWFANRVWVYGFLRMPMKDATGGFRIWRKETLIGMGMDQIRSNGYVFQVEIAYLSWKLGYKIAEIPIHFPDRHAGQSKMGLDIQIEAALGVFRLLRHYRHFTPADRQTDYALQQQTS